MRVKVIGKQVVSYTNKAGKQVDGLSLFYTAPKNGVIGEYCDNIWVTKGGELYNKLMAVDTSKHIMMDVVYEMLPGSRFPTLIDIKINV
jgi:hypothetical protein